MELLHPHGNRTVELLLDPVTLTHTPQAVQEAFYFTVLGEIRLSSDTSVSKRLVVVGSGELLTFSSGMGKFCPPAATIQTWVDSPCDARATPAVLIHGKVSLTWVGERRAT